MPPKDMSGVPCDHFFTPDPWEPRTRRCLYCQALWEDVVPLKLPPRAPVDVGMNSPLVRALRNIRLRDD